MIEDQLYRQELLEAYQNPKNRGKIDDPDFEAKLDNPACGDEVKLQLAVSGKLSSEGKIKKAVFSGNGCAVSQASASLLTEHLEGKTLSEAKKLETGDILKLLEINPTPARMGCALLSLNTLKEALKNEL